jgi:DNA-binding transcriptional ArsR family regulator
MPKRKVSLADWERVEKATDILKTVAHPLRLRIVDLLTEGERTVGDLQNNLGVSQSLTSQQLSLMKSRGVLRSRRVGKLTYYSIERPEVIQVLHCLRKC